jgi:hypothetical protein
MGGGHPGTRFFLHLLRCELVWIVTEINNGKIQGEPKSLEKIINSLIY